MCRWKNVKIGQYLAKISSLPFLTHGVFSLTIHCTAPLRVTVWATPDDMTWHDVDLFSVSYVSQWQWYREATSEYKPVVWLGGDAVAMIDFFIYARRSYEVRSTTTLWRPQIRDKRATSDVHDISKSQVNVGYRRSTDRKHPTTTPCRSNWHVGTTPNNVGLCPIIGLG